VYRVGKSLKENVNLISLFFVGYREPGNNSSETWGFLGGECRVWLVEVSLVINECRIFVKSFSIMNDRKGILTNI
jgi:hypothetical protein